jgi:hypothetical protein
MHIFRIGCVILLVCQFGISAIGQKSESDVLSQDEPIRFGKPIERSPFRYVIVFGISDIEKEANAIQEKASFDVIMENSAFNERNLILLYRLLDKRIVEKKYFTATVFTNLEATYTPEEWDQMGRWEFEDLKMFKSAYFFRNGFGKYLVYSIPGQVRDKRVEIEQEIKKK